MSRPDRFHHAMKSNSYQTTVSQQIPDAPSQVFHIVFIEIKVNRFQIAFHVVLKN